MAVLKTEDIRLIVRIAEMHYLEQYSQKEIADMLGMSKSKVCRCIKCGVENGIVKIIIENPIDKQTKLEDFFKETYKLRDVVIVDDQQPGTGGVWDHIGLAAAQYLKRIVRKGDVIGLQWGRTGMAISKMMEDMPDQDLKVVQIMGSTFVSQHNMDEVFMRYSRKMKADIYRVPIPVIVQTKEIHDAMMCDEGIRHAMEWYKKCNIIIVTVASVGTQSTSFMEKFVNNEEVKLLQERCAVGDMCGRFFDLDGKICCKELDERTSGMTLDTIAENNNSILVACGAEKVLPIIGALKGGYGKVLITDRSTAEQIRQMIR